MQTEKRNINELHEHENNVRKHSQKQIEELVKSLTQFGAIRPIVIDENNTILCGHGLYKAYLSMGKQEVDVLVKKGLTEKQKKKLMLADNKIYTLGIDDYDALEKAFKELEGDFDIPGYDANILEELYGSSSISENDFKKIEPSSQIGEVVDRVNKQNNSTNQEDTENVIYAKTDEETKKAFIVCPHCKGKIYLDDNN